MNLQFFPSFLVDSVVDFLSPIQLLYDERVIDMNKCIFHALAHATQSEKHAPRHFTVYRDCGIHISTRASSPYLLRTTNMNEINSIFWIQLAASRCAHTRN